MNRQVETNYELWKSQQLEDEALVKELQDIDGDELAINDRFYRELEFGTAGLRGVLGAGTNRMNIYTVAKATRGLAKYLLQNNSKPSIAIAYDSRNNSDVFAKIAAGVMASMGVKVYIWKELMPTPSLSFAVRYFKCDGGIVITASHNPAKYNGYKAYGSDGCQMATKAADAVYALIGEVDIFKDYEVMDFEEGIQAGLIEIISEEVFDAYISTVSNESLAGNDIDKSVKIAYTPLHGAGLRCVTSCLERNGFTNIAVVKEQANPDGNFPTCPYPNPEIREALEVGLRVAKEVDADILIATDPDCDRAGIAVKEGDDFALVTGNEVGMLLLDYICKRRIALGKMPKNPIAVKSIVSIDMATRIANKYGVEMKDVLTGFKFIGEQILHLEEKGEEDRYIFGFEESYGYLTGAYVRDKDAVNAALMIAEMFAYYKGEGKSLLDVLRDLYAEYGYCLNTTYSFEFEGEAGMKKMADIMSNIRSTTPSNIGGKKVLSVLDYEKSLEKNIETGEEKLINLPKSNVIKLLLEDYASIVFRPSGTEPKLKIYISISAKDKEEAKKKETLVYEQAKGYMK